MKKQKMEARKNEAGAADTMAHWIKTASRELRNGGLDLPPLALPVATEFADQVDQVLGEIGQMLKAKNKAYGNSALDPVRVFSTAGPAEQIRVRIDDKISRLKRGHSAGEDTVTDLIGYLVLLKIAESTQGAPQRQSEGKTA